MFTLLEEFQQKLVMPRGALGMGVTGSGLLNVSSSGFGDCIWNQVEPGTEKGLRVEFRDCQVPLDGTASALGVCRTWSLLPCRGLLILLLCSSEGLPRGRQS